MQEGRPIAGRAIIDAARRWRSSLVLLPFCIYFAVRRGQYGLLDGADLVIHEAGHAFFFWGGAFLQAAGGTLMQLFLPSLLVWHFRRHAYRFGAQVSLLWLGQNGINVSVYAADARARVLPLLGNGEHDWHYMLGRLGWLPYDTVVGHVFFALALLCFAVLLLWPGLPGQTSPPRPATVIGLPQPGDFQH